MQKKRKRIEEIERNTKNASSTLMCFNEDVRVNFLPSFLRLFFYRPLYFFFTVFGCLFAARSNVSLCSGVYLCIMYGQLIKKTTNKREKKKKKKNSHLCIQYLKTREKRTRHTSASSTMMMIFADFQ